MQSTPLGPWGVGASAGPATAGLKGDPDTGPHFLCVSHIQLYCTLRAWEYRVRLRILARIIIGVLYACTDRILVITPLRLLVAALPSSAVT